MNNYHIYAEIGRGKGSVVYKGREKKTINYVAIKSVEKQYKNKILNEVAVLYSLVHPNILRFINWYETSKHIWLIVEYCTGGDLLSMLRLDQAMPEVACKRFAYDILQGLQFVHSKGYIYGDLKPSNILVNEYGTLLLCDFGLAKRVMTEEEYVKMQQQEDPGKRGSPYYMSPELFYSDGIHSFASDFWAFGCLLFELATGRPPFYSKNLEQVVTAILEEEPKPLPQDDGQSLHQHSHSSHSISTNANTSSPPSHKFSHSFQDLLDRCLEKDPARRMSWDEMRQHPWFHDLPRPLDLLPIPDQPVFERLFKSATQTHSNVHSAHSASVRQSQRLDKPPVDVMRLSFQARKNRAAEAELAKSSSSPQASDEIEEQLDGTITLNSYDAELNFSAQPEPELNIPLPPSSTSASSASSRPSSNAIQQSGRILREPPKPSVPSELDELEAEFTRLKAKEEEGEEHTDNDNDEDVNDSDIEEVDEIDDGDQEDDSKGDGEGEGEGDLYELDEEYARAEAEWAAQQSRRPPPRDAFRTPSHQQQYVEEEDYSDAMDLNDAHGGDRFNHHQYPQDAYYGDDADLEAYPSHGGVGRPDSSFDHGETEFSMHRAEARDASRISVGARTSSTASTASSSRKAATASMASKLPIISTRSGSNSVAPSRKTTSSSSSTSSKPGSSSTTSTARSTSTRKPPSSSSSSGSSSSSTRKPSTPSTSASTSVSVGRTPSTSTSSTRTHKPGTSGGTKTSSSSSSSTTRPQPSSAWQDKR